MDVNRALRTAVQTGNVLIERHWVDGITYQDTVRTYDANDNLLTETDPALNTSRFTYDLRGNAMSRTDPAGHSWTYTGRPRGRPRERPGSGSAGAGCCP